MDMATQFQILDEVDCISCSTNILGKGMNVSHPAHVQWLVNTYMLHLCLNIFIQIYSQPHTYVLNFYTYVLT